MRALGGTGWQASREGFEAYAAASAALCRAYLQVQRAGSWLAWLGVHRCRGALLLKCMWACGACHLHASSLHACTAARLHNPAGTPVMSTCKREPRGASRGPPAVIRR